MIDYWNIKDTISSIRQWEPGCWAQVTTPESSEIDALQRQWGIPDYFFTDIEDAYERPRFDSDSGWNLIILRIPLAKEDDRLTPYVTVPLGIIFSERALFTVCYFNAEMMDDFIIYQQRRAKGFVDYVDMIFRIFMSAAEWYLLHIKHINGLIEKAKAALSGSVDNRSLVSLSMIQDSLTYFITSLKGDIALLEKLRSKLDVDSVDEELIDDVAIELNQAAETTQIYEEILDSTMDTFSSIINNNMNTVMRTLTSVSIILMLPTLISSFLGMNLINGMEQKWWGSPAVLIFSFAIAIVCWLIFRKKKLV